MLNLDLDLLHLQPREEVAQLRRATMLPPLPAGNSLNEQYARAQLHAGNEADIDPPPAAGGALIAPVDEPLTTHWTRVLHHDLYGANDAASDSASDAASNSAVASAPALVAIVGIAYRLGEDAIGPIIGWLTA